LIICGHQCLKMFDNDPIFLNVINTVGECQIGKCKQDLFPYLCGLILGQRIRFRTAQTYRKNLYTLTGSYNYTPHDILTLSDQSWNQSGIDKNKRALIMAIAEYAQGHPLTDKESLNNLKQFSGIGTWTISTLFIIYGLDLNLFPLNDKHVNKQLQTLYQISEAEIPAFVDRWSPYKSVAFWYLWKYNLN
jgi:DNA-3-methyladenine glycosylase II